MATWFWIATIITIGMLHIVNSMALPISAWKSYSAYAGVFDANIQWWYGHNAVGFLLTTPILGLMYYFLPKQAGRPINDAAALGAADVGVAMPRAPTSRSTLPTW